MKALPFIAVPIGDPAGIGPEIAVKAGLSPQVRGVCHPVLVGNRSVLDTVLEFCHINKPVETTAPFDNSLSPETLRLVEVEDVDPGPVVMGRVQAVCGHAAYGYIEKSVDLAMEKKVSAIATTTINKVSLRAAGIPHIGHTEILGSLAEKHTGQAYKGLTLFETGDLRVSFLSRHLSLKQAIEYISVEHIYQGIQETLSGLRSLGFDTPRLAVAGLNPHCGENGRFGDEEINSIIPAIEQAQKEGHNVTGPIGADSVFYMARKGHFDGVLSLYHDQGHIAAKTYDFDRTISLTLGLPFLRTSVDHGTAFDIAGKGIARELSMITAIQAAAKYSSLPEAPPYLSRS